MAHNQSNFPGMKDPRRQSALGRLADKDVELGHAREWSRERMAAARKRSDEAESQAYDGPAFTEGRGVTREQRGAKFKDAMERGIAIGTGAPAIAASGLIPMGLRAGLLAQTPGALIVDAVNKDTESGGLNAALGGLAALGSAAAPAVLAMLATYPEDAQAGILSLLSRVKGPAKYTVRYDGPDLARAKAELSEHIDIGKTGFDRKNGAITIMRDERQVPVAAYHIAPRGDPFEDSNYLSALHALDGGGKGAGTQAVEEATSRNKDYGGLRAFSTPSARGFWDKYLQRHADWGEEFVPEYEMKVLRTPPKEFAKGGLARVAARMASDSVPARRGVSDVIKEKGGNWLTGSVEEALGGLKRGGEEEALRAMRRVNPALDEQAARQFIAAVPAHGRDAAINNWIDKQLTRYVKNEMATPEDPIRALAERGVLHFEPGEAYVGSLPKTRIKNATSQPASGWEDQADTFINTGKPREFISNANFPESQSWLGKVPAEQDIYWTSGRHLGGGDLGFSHLIDELANALNPDSGLPRHLLLDPKSMGRVSVPQAVERVAAINKWREAQKAEANAKLANNAATALHKEYPNKGFKWVELKAPDAWPEGVDREAYGDLGRYSKSTLSDALKYEGDTMGHCVGGYCDDVVSGRTRIYSLRDAKGEPHVTVEVAPGKKLTEADLPDNVRDQLADFDGSREEFEALVQKSLVEHAIGDRIVQIKGKANRAPSPEYLPFVQDFVKSGKWSAVGDLQNSGLVQHPSGYLTRDELGKLVDEGDTDAVRLWQKSYIDR